MRTTLIALSVTLLSASLVAAEKKPQGGIIPKVFVTSVGATNGFTDPNKDNQDSMENLRARLPKQRIKLAVVDKREDADIVLIVQSREKSDLTVGWLGAGRDCTVRVKFIYKDIETEMSGSAQGGSVMSGGAWSKAADKVAKQVAQWVQENASRMIEARASR